MLLDFNYFSHPGHHEHCIFNASY